MLISWILKRIHFFIGAGFVGVLVLALWSSVAGVISSPPEQTAEEWVHAKFPEKEVSFASDGPLGTFDFRKVQRGFQVYKKVCSQCHSLSLLAFRDLRGLGYSEAEVKKIAKDWGAENAKQPAFDAKAGTWGERDNTLADHFPKVYYPGTGSPPDLSLIAKARHGGGRYIYSLLTGYQAEPAELIEKFPAAKTGDGQYFNPYFANLNIAMPPPLTSEGQVEYLDGTRATVPQMAEDVSAFLIWASEPTMQERHQIGFAVLIFLLITTFLAYGAYQSVWRGVKH